MRKKIKETETAKLIRKKINEHGNENLLIGKYNTILDELKWIDKTFYNQTLNIKYIKEIEIRVAVLWERFENIKVRLKELK